LKEKYGQAQWKDWWENEKDNTKKLAKGEKTRK
jgi:hypothetical protein